MRLYSTNDGKRADFDPIQIWIRASSANADMEGADR